MNKKQLVGIVVVVAVVLVVSGIVALLTLRGMFFPESTEHIRSDPSNGPYLIVGVDQLVDTERVEYIYLLFIDDDQKVTIIAEELSVGEDILFSGPKNIERHLLDQIEEKLSVNATHYIILENDGQKIINNSYENTQNIPVLTKDTDFCEILNSSDGIFLDQLFSALQGHVKSDLELTVIREKLAKLQEKSNCYFEVIEK